MKYQGGELSETQIGAGVAAMTGEFSGGKVMTALEQAGVAWIVPAANTLIAREVKAGRIYRVTRGLYRQA
ncbi:hypothetical protein WP12_03065 [Sphingomonas sp. SRS2]|nr:hypothetical protein WP12_03065 [Sphingomonas sp. SRS2]